jgi:hypothetical protein
VVPLPTPGLAQGTGDGAVQLARGYVLGLLPHPFDYASQTLARGQVLPKIPYLPFERFDSFKKLIHPDGIASGHLRILYASVAQACGLAPILPP